MVKKDKGKARAIDPDHPTESSPLLGSPSHSRTRSPLIDTRSNPNAPGGDRRNGITQRSRTETRSSILYAALIIALSLLAGCILFLALLINSFRPSNAELNSLQDTAFQYDGPDGISIVNVTDDGVLVNVSIRAGIDWDQALGIQRWTNEADKEDATVRGDRGTGAEWWESLRKWTAGKVMDRLDKRSVQVEIPEQVLILPEHFMTIPLFSVTVPHPVMVPIVPRADTRSKDWLPPIHILALAKPIASTGDLMTFAQKAWELGEARVVIGVTKVQVTLPLSGWLARFGKMEKEDITRQLQMPVPRLPGLPSPGKPLNLSSLVHLDSYTFNTRHDGLHIIASASIPNMIPQLNTSLPFNLPFSIHLPDNRKMAEVITAPIQFNSWSSRINVHISGLVVADLGESHQNKHDSRTYTNGDADSGLSLFLQNYLHGLDNPISIQGLSTLPSFANSNLSPPKWLLSTLPSLSIPLSFPGPKPKPKIIQSVTIEHMRLSETRGKMLASGIVIAEISLPPGMESVEVDVNAVRPDILVFDGPPPDDDDNEVKATAELDDDEDGDGDEEYPARAFGHIKPEEYLHSTSERYVNPEHPDWIVVKAPMEDIPVEILHGRDGVMRAFVSKVVFKGGALAGIKGQADVNVKVKGVGGEVGLGGLPVRGEVWIGRQRSWITGLHEGESNGP